MTKLYDIDSNGCWIWLGGKFVTGYGCYKRGFAHRVFYEIHKGNIEPNHHIHHTCHTKLCVNPDHLLKISRYEHNKLHKQKELLYCKHGHKREPDNIHVTKQGMWQCMQCNNNRQKGYNAIRVAPVHNRRLEIIEGVRKDYGTMPVKEIADKYGIGWRSVYRYIKSTPTKLGYFND